MEGESFRRGSGHDARRSECTLYPRLSLPRHEAIREEDEGEGEGETRERK